MNISAGGCPWSLLLPEGIATDSSSIVARLGVTDWLASSGWLLSFSRHCDERLLGGKLARGCLFDFMLTLCPPVLHFTHVVTGAGCVLGSHFGPGEVTDGVRGDRRFRRRSRLLICARVWGGEANRVVANLEAI